MIWTGELSFWRATRNTAANTAAIVGTQSAIKATFRALSSGTKIVCYPQARRSGIVLRLY